MLESNHVALFGSPLMSRKPLQAAKFGVMVKIHVLSMRIDLLEHVPRWLSIQIKSLSVSSERTISEIKRYFTKCKESWEV